MAVHRGTAWFEAPWWTVSVEPDDGGQVQGGSYAEAHALAVKLIATAQGVAESSVTLLLDLVPGPREPS
ncbi:MAG TPA: hypothetical protein VFS29_09660 [Motilibacteraceae bacterium]|nr:hypothetical protein [Motilibacteraceae bacterium]